MNTIISFPKETYTFSSFRFWGMFFISFFPDVKFFDHQMTSFSRTITQLGHSRYSASVLSGVLLGVSFPSYPFIRLELLAWFAFVPLLLSLRTVERAGELFRRLYITMLLFCLISLWWVTLATLPGGVLTIVAQALFLTVPLFVFYLIKKMAGFHFALFSLPAGSLSRMAYSWKFPV